MNTKGFLLLLVTVIVIGGSIGGAFAGGLALGRNQGDDDASGATLLQQQFGGGQMPSGAIQGGQTGQDAPQGFGGQFSGRGGAGGTFSRDVFNGTVTTLDGNLLTVSAGENENQVDLSENASIQIFGPGTTDDISEGDRVLVIVSGDTTAGGPVDAISVIVNPPEGGGVFGGGGSGFGGRGGLGGEAISVGILNGIVGEVNGSQITVTTDSGENQVNLGDQVAIQLYEPGTVEDISPGDQVLVTNVVDDESGGPVTTTSVIVNPPEGGFGGGGGFGGRPRRP